MRQDLKTDVGFGNLTFNNRKYKITQIPLGKDEYECRIDNGIAVININIDHPAYDQAVQVKCVKLTVFHAIAAAFAVKESTTPLEFYTRLDELIRFQAERMKLRSKA